MKFRKEGERVLLTLAKGDYINYTFEAFAEFEGIGFGWLNGIGAIEDPEIGYYSIKDKKYHRKQFIGKYELTSLIGNITLKEDKPFSHTHITFSDIDYHVFGGHLFDARVTAAGEFIMHTEAKIITRQMNSSIGLPLWCLEESIN
jgi:predicted DNA-binding protein with PD1-like motif